MRRFAFVLLLLAAAPAFAEDVKPVFPGPTKDGGFLLPNGWTLTPVGQHAVTTDLPLNIIPLKDNTHALVASSGFNSHDLMLVNIVGEPKIVAKMTNRQSWYGLATNADESKIWWSGGGQGSLHTFDWKDSKLVRSSPADADLPKLTPSEIEKLAEALGNAATFKSGLHFDAKTDILYSLDIHHQKDAKDKESPKEGRIHATNTNDHTTRVAVIGGRPYDVVVGPGGHQIFVSDWAGQRVLVLDPVTLKVEKKIGVGAQ